MLALVLFWCAGTYFSETTVYDPSQDAMRVDMYILVDENGTVHTVSEAPIPDTGDATKIRGAVVLPHWSDFYTLIQDRGLGVDENLDDAVQGRIARYLKNTGFFGVRDPVFPPLALGDAFNGHVGMLPMQGYVEVMTGPSRNFAVVADPTRPVAELAKQLPDKGPVTLWWTSAGFDDPVIWPEHADYLRQLMQYFRQRDRKVGAYVQDATAVELRQLLRFAPDFIEGLPADGNAMDPGAHPNLTWVPLAALNDKRYCTKYFEKRLQGLQSLGLFDKVLLGRAQDRIDQVAYQIRDRCRIWQSRRNYVLEPLGQWLRDGGKVALASGGGHLFSFSGDIRSELDLLSDLGASEAQLLQAAFKQTPTLLGLDGAYMEPGQPAHFIVYRQDLYWAHLVNRKVDLNYVNGELIEEAPQVTLPTSIP